MTPQEKSKQMIEAIKYCLNNKLLSNEEVQAAKSKEQKLQLACKAIMKMQLHQKKQAEKEYQTLSEEDKDTLAILQDDSKTIWKRPKR